MKFRTLLLSALIFFLGFLGVLTRSGGFFVLAFPLVVYLGVAIYYSPETISLQVTRQVSAEKVTYGKPVSIALLITNQGDRQEELFLEDLITPALPIYEGQARKTLSLDPGERVALSYHVSGERGRYQFKGLRVVARDHSGLFQKQELITAQARLVVYPKMTKIKRVAIQPLQTHGFAGPISARKPGSGTDFYGVREYQLGDSLRKINWRVSARHERSYYTNEFEQEGIADVGLILDARDQSDIRNVRGSLFEYSVEATASLADTFLSDGHRLALLVYGFGLDRVFPGYGRVQRERILNTLARAQTGVNFVLESLERLPTRFFPAKSQLVMVSPLLPNDLQPLIRLRASGYEIMIVSPNPIDFEASGMFADNLIPYAMRLAEIERNLLLRKLNQAGIRVVDWHVDQRLDGVIHASLAHRPVRRML